MLQERRAAAAARAGPALEVWNVAAEDDRAFLRTTFTELRAKAMRRREEFGP